LLKKILLISGISLGLLIVGTWVFFQFFFFYEVEGNSMSPVLKDGETVLSRSFALQSIDRGDIIGFLNPTDKNEYVKRVVGLPGDTVAIKNQKVWVNGKPVDDDFQTKGVSDFGPVKVPKGNVFVLGEDLVNSVDSRAMGPIPFSRVTGVLVFY